MSEATLIDATVQKGNALAVAYDYAQIDGGHHKAWVIDQMCRALLGDDYKQWIKDFCTGEDGPETYTWDEGIPP